MVIGEKYRRKNPSLYGARFRKRLLDEVVWFRSEKLPNYSEFYVDNDHITRIDNNGDHLISGRRGTGKTHLLGAFHELIQRRSNEVSVFVSLTDIGYQSHEYLESQDTNSKNRKVARQVFGAFLHDFFDKLLDSVSEVLMHCDDEKKQRVNDTLQFLLAEIVLGSPTPVRSSGVETSENTDASETQKKAGAGLAAKLDSIGLNIGASIGRESVSKEDTTGMTKVESIYVTDPRRVRKLLVQIADQCGLETIHILIDEWMELDKKSESRIQSHFAQLLKMTFFNEPRISVKIASIWSQTDVYERKGMDVSQGLQIGQDIQHTIDLDSSFLTSECEIISFVKNLLYKRLRRKVPDLIRFEVTEGAVDDEFITELFDDIKNFKVFVTAGHGIPRDLMRIFEKSFQRIRADFEEYAVNYELIIDVSRDIYSANKRDVIAPGSPTKQQWIFINNYMEHTGRRFFIVDSDAPQKSTALRNLIDHELIHEVHAPVLPRMIRRNHRLYMIDYGTFVDWKKASFAPTEEMLGEFIFPDIDMSNFDLESCKVDIVSDAEIYMNCKSCGKSVERSSPVVVKHQLCPLCGDSVA